MSCVYVSPTEAPDWGPDRLGSNVLASGDRLDLALPPGDYDVLVEDCDHGSLYQDSVTVVAGDNLELS